MCQLGGILVYHPWLHGRPAWLGGNDTYYLSRLVSPDLPSSQEPFPLPRLSEILDSVPSLPGACGIVLSP